MMGYGNCGSLPPGNCRNLKHFPRSNTYFKRCNQRCCVPVIPPAAADDDLSLSLHDFLSCSRNTRKEGRRENNEERRCPWIVSCWTWIDSLRLLPRFGAKSVVVLFLFRPILFDYKMSDTIVRGWRREPRGS